MNFFDKLWPIFVAVILTQWLTQKFIEMRKPKLEMVPEGTKAGSWKYFNGSPEEPYHVWRINVQQVKLPRYLKWLSRYAALQCKADLTFYNSNDQKLFTMQGRWVNTPEVSLISPFNQQEKVIYPDRIDVGYEPQPLDCIVKFDNEQVAYGWNNEAYPTNGRNPRTRLGVGTYKVTVRLSGPNFRQLSTKFDIAIAGDWQGTSLTLV